MHRQGMPLRESKLTFAKDSNATESCRLCAAQYRLQSVGSGYPDWERFFAALADGLLLRVICHIRQSVRLMKRRLPLDPTSGGTAQRGSVNRIAAV
jgi:hypothetical protein